MWDHYSFWFGWELQEGDEHETGLLGDADVDSEQSLNGKMSKKESSTVLKCDAEFIPIEHPLEPEMDQPIKCPMLKVRRNNSFWMN